jgi:flagellar P-ring protein precursor FlgI
MKYTSTSLSLSLGVVVATISLPLYASQVRIKDIARVQGQRQHSIIGYGIVTGLAGTGDSASNRATRQSLANLLAQFNLTVPPEAITSRNVATVMVSAQVPAFAKPGDVEDVSVTSMGDARSLVGGNLLITPLKGADGHIYALAQGALTVGGYKYDANGNVTQKNHPTAATVPGGAVMELSPPVSSSTGTEASNFAISLYDADYTTAGRMADAINREIGPSTAIAIDAQAVNVQVPASYQGHLVELIRRVELLQVDTDQRARVVINERTGTIVSGAAVRIEPVAISYGDLKISVTSETNVSQPLAVGGYNPGVATVPYTNTRVDVREQSGAALTTGVGGTVADLVQVLARLKTNTRDVVSILKALKSAGALHAELIVQ